MQISYGCSWGSKYFEYWNLISTASRFSLKQPFALDPSIAHKSGANGLARQIELLSMATGLSIETIDRSSDGARHDRVDALLSAWIASLGPESLAIHGDGRRDTIWSVAATRRIG
jgi:hypothetical protein